MGMGTLVLLGETAGMVPVVSIDSPDSDVKLMFGKVTGFVRAYVCFSFTFWNRVECRII